MAPKTAKRIAAEADLEFYFDPQWRSWGLIDPACQVEGMWLSPGALRHLHPDEFRSHYLDPMVARVQGAN